MKTVTRPMVRTDRLDTCRAFPGMIFVNDRAVNVRPNQYACMRLLIEKHGEMVTYIELSQLLGVSLAQRHTNGSINEMYSLELQRSVKAILRMCKALPESWIKNVKGKGIILNVPDEMAA